MNKVSSPALHDSAKSHLTLAPYLPNPPGLLFISLETWAVLNLFRMFIVVYSGFFTMTTPKTDNLAYCQEK